jgi:hypothetical protein
MEYSVRKTGSADGWTVETLEDGHIVFSGRFSNPQEAERVRIAEDTRMAAKRKSQQLRRTAD